MFVADIFIEELWKIRCHLLEQPDEYVVQSKIEKPYRRFFVKVYRSYSDHLKRAPIQTEPAP
jgi:hypothetical protein